MSLDAYIRSFNYLQIIFLNYNIIAKIVILRLNIPNFVQILTLNIY